MALQVVLNDSMVGGNFPEAYAKVEHARVFKDQTLIFVNWYADEQARIDMKQPVNQKEFSAPTADLSGEFLPTMYNWLKTQPEFEGSIDV